MSRRCRRCGEMKPLVEFYTVTNGRGATLYPRQFCKPCWAVEARKRQAEYRRVNPAWWREVSRRYSAKLRHEVLGHYSGGDPRCACCGETELRFLTLDHVANDGAAHRRAVRSETGNKRTPTGTTMYRWARRSGYPPIFQSLCWNCNLAKKLGACPHQTLTLDVLVGACLA